MDTIHKSYKKHESGLFLIICDVLCGEGDEKTYGIS